MDSDEGKLFLGGIAWDTTEERLSDYFGKYGDVSQTVIMRDKITGRPRGFGFVMFSDPSVIDSVLQDRHAIDGRNVEAKRALSREEQQASRPANNINRSSTGGGGASKTKKIFVGGLPSTLTEEQFRQYFETYGDVTDVVIMFDQTTNRPRGFGFISFDSEDAVDRVLQKNFHELNNKLVEVKRALPKDANPGGGGSSFRSSSFTTANNGGSGLFDGQMDGNRFMQAAQNSGGGYPAYSGYGQPSYGGYGGYGGYNVGGYGGVNSGYGGSGPVKNPWSGGQTPGYGGAGYGPPNAGYGAGNGLWNGGGGGGGGAPVGQSPSGGSSYGYASYGSSNDGYNSNTGGYGRGAVGDQQAAGGGGTGGYMAMGGGYNGQPGWRSES
ncbi:hypothetical protein LXL04_036833 [Taraxacum kok-saghyz]